MASTADNSDLPSLSSPGTEMGHRNISPAKIGHWQPPQQENIDTIIDAASCLYMANK
jgi:hypothetical protein